MLKRHIKLHNKDYKSIGKSVQKVWNSLVKAGNKTNDVSKLSQGLDKVGKFAAPVQALTSVAGLGMDIYNTIEANKQMKEQMDLAKKNFNLELEKQQKYELANNQLAASVDKAWGGSGEVAPTIDYSKYRPMKHEGLDMVQDKSDGGALIQGGAGKGMWLWVLTLAQSHEGLKICHNQA